MTEAFVARLPRSSVVFAVLVCLELAAPRAWAQSAAGTADALFEQGRRAMQAGHLDVACQRFRESNRLDPAAGTQLNLAVCEEKRGKLATAWELFRAAGDALPEGDSRIALARDHAAALDARLPRLTIALGAGAPADTVVLRDDVELRSGSLGVPLPVDPGKHQLTVRATGHVERVVTVDIAEAENKQIEVEAGELRPAAPNVTASPRPTVSEQPSPVPRRDDGAARRGFGYVVGGLGVVGMGTGALYGILTLRERNAVDAHCSDALKLCDASGKSAADRGRIYGAVSTAGFITGAVALPIGVYLVVSGARPDSGAPRDGARAEIRPLLGPHGARVNVRAVW